MTYDEKFGAKPITMKDHYAQHPEDRPAWMKDTAKLGVEPAEVAPANAESKVRRKAGKLDRWGVFNSMVDHHLATLSENELRVWVSLFRMCSAPFWTATVGQSVIADRCGISHATVKRMLRRLEARGMVEVVRRGNAMIGPSTYRVTARPPRVDDWMDSRN